MKKALVFLLAAVLLLSGCSGEPSEYVSQTSSAANDETSDIIVTSEVSSESTTASAAATEPVLPETSETDEPAAAQDEQEDPLPAMDGSTSAIPLEAGIRAKLLGISYKDALELVNHSKTHIAFQNLLDGTVDLIYTVPISDEQRQKADEAGVELISVPVAKEGFVFVVNKDNPVDSLTQQQLRDIYSGRITNWKEVGGNDAEIIPYQRNLDSGSQNYMAEFMGDTPLMTAKTELYATGMGGLMDKIALYDNSADAIGYSVYSYAAQMYANDNKVKFIAVDGIAPTKETMADDSYPLSSCTYIMYTDKADEKTREFAQWVVSDEGQLCVLQSGYLPVNGMDIPDEYMPYSAAGTGKPKPADYKPSEQYVTLYPSKDDFYRFRQGYYRITGLADDAFEEQINADLIEAQDYIMQFEPDWSKEQESWTAAHYSDLAVEMQIYNGYLSILLSYWTPGAELIDPMTSYDHGCYDKAVSLVYDLVEQRRITELSDLFYEGEDFVPMLNNILADHAAMYTADTNIGQKSDFSGLLGDVEVFTLSSVCLNDGNTYFHGMPKLSFSQNDPIKDSMVIWEYRDCTGVFDDEPSVYDAQEYVYGSYEEDGIYFNRIESSRFHTEEEIAELNAKLGRMSQEALDYYKDLGINARRIDIFYNERFNLYEASLSRTELTQMVYFDGDTCKLLTPEELLCEDWLDYFSFSDEERERFMHFVAFLVPFGEESVTVYVNMRVDENATTYAEAYIPLDKVNPKYFSDLTFD